MIYYKLTTTLLFLAILFSCQNTNKQEDQKGVKTEIKEEKSSLIELELIDNNPVKQFDNSSDARFDLSGICNYKNDIYVVADKAWNKTIYKINTVDTKMEISSENEVCVFEKIDFEGIDSDSAGFYIINERKSEVYYKNANTCSVNTLNIDWKQLKVKAKDWKNKGLEGVALDKKKQILYLVKERAPRRIFSYNLITSELIEPFKDLFDKKDGDFTDAKFENGKLYLLDRSKSQVFRIDVRTRETYAVSIKNRLNPDNKRLYETDNLKYGTAEALLLTSNELWIGIDNNGENVSAYGQELGLNKGNKPAILIFKRPKDF